MFLTKRCFMVGSLNNPDNLSMLVLTLLPYKARITLQRRNSLSKFKFAHVLKDIFGGSLKITLQYKNNPQGLSGLLNANAKLQRFSYAISQIATLPPVVALNRSSKSQIAARYAASWHAVSQIALASFL